MRTPRKKPTEIDLSIPVPIKKLIETSDDCFGREYLPGCNECNMCHDNAVCAIVYKEVVDRKAVKVKMSQPTKQFLDEVNMDIVPFDKIAKLINDGKEYDYNDLVEYVMEKASVNNRRIAEMRVNTFIHQNKFKNENGRVHK